MSTPPPPPGWEPPAGPSWPPPPPAPGGPPLPGPPQQGPQQGPPPGYGGPGAPPFYPPPPGAPLGPPPRKSGPGALIAALIGGGLVVVVLIAIVVFAVAGGGKSSEEQLNSAAGALERTKVVAYKGVVSGGTHTLQGDLNVTRGGRATGQVTWNSDTVTLLAADGKLFVKGDASYWRRQTLSVSEPYFLSGGPQWGRLSSTRLNVDFKELAPSTLASKLRSAARAKLKPTKTTIKGVKALRFGDPAGFFYLSDADEPALLRYEASQPRIAVDVDPRDKAAEETAALGEMRDRVGELKDSFDSSVQPRIGEWSKTPCSTNSDGCRVSGRVTALTTSDQPLQVEVRYTLRSGKIGTTGRDLGNCTTGITLRGTAGVWAECRVTGGAWSSWSRGSERDYRRQAEFKVGGASSTEIEGMRSGLDQE
ncbi:hypothetical protein [Actinomadura hibisca]|uniref:hypothetical protein n=1 Tax=Actinomadura hibisca TaxID=68565 RepID=UPI000835CCA1|nr:hypothetical protein [Actinomadura hibisca]